ncbi:MAG TPA: acyl-CoA dehydrogenase family protein [Candidatus Acidoferrum sp.]|jgi:alkylation response protein AidB-like acyl-CoA dehydrogenase
MDFSLNDHQKLIRDTVRQFMEAEVRPSVKQRDREERFPAEEIKKLAEMGCCGMMIPEEWGGPGLDTLSYVLMLEEVARVDAGMATSLSVTNSAVQVPLTKFGTEEQKKKYLRRLATGEILGAFCLTEPAAGSDAAGIQARATTVARVGVGLGVGDGEEHRLKSVPRPASPAPALALGAGDWGGAALGTPSGDVYRLNGTKTWVSNGQVAGLFIVFAKTDPDAGSKGISAFLVEPGFPGFKVGRHEDKMGQRSSPAVEILLNDCEVPRENRLGEEGQGLKIALSALDGGRIGIASVALGLAEGALDESVKYAKHRRAFGKTIGEFQAIQWMLADMQTEIEAARGLVYHAAWLKDAHPGKLGAASSKAKLYASEMVNRVVAKAVQIHGSAGYSRETDVERMYRDARVITIYEGTSEIQRMIIARELLGRSV